MTKNWTDQEELQVTRQVVQMMDYCTSVQSACMNRMQEWLKDALSDPKVKRAIQDNEKLYERLFIISEVNAQAAKNVMEMNQRLVEESPSAGGEPA